MGRKPLTVRVARWSALHPWHAVALWVAFVIAAIAIGALAGTSKAEQDGLVGESARASKIIDDHFPDDPSIERVVVTARSGPLDRSEATAALSDAAARMRAVPGRSRVSGIEDPVGSPDGTALMMAVTMSGDPQTAYERVQPLLDATAAAQRAHPAVRVEQVGAASLRRAFNDTSMRDFKRAEMFSVPVTLIILIVAFGALIAASVPVLLALSAVGSAIGLSALASHLVPANESVNSVILLIGMAVGVDYSLFYLRREREERARGAGHLDAVEIAAATSGHTVVVSGLAVIISMTGMFLARDGIFSSFAVGSILVVGVSVLGSLTVLPAMLAKLGRWVDRPRVPLLWRLTASAAPGEIRPAGSGMDGENQLAGSGLAGAKRPTGSGTRDPRVWSFVLRPALRHPLVTLVGSVGALVALAAPALGMTLKLPSIDDLVRGTSMAASYHRLTTAFPSTGSEHTVVVELPPATGERAGAAMRDLAARAGSDPLFAHDQQLRLTASPDGRAMRLTIGTPYASGSRGADRSLRRLRDDLVPQTMGALPGARYAVGGDIAISADYSAHIRQRLPLVIGFVLLLTFVAMAWTFRSLVVAATAIGLNMLSVGAAYGLLTLVFQRTWAQGLLDFHSTNSVTSWLPLFLFVILFGLSMDYHVFVVSRIREAVVAGVPNREAVASGITRSAGVVTSAAVVMVAVFSIFGTLSMPQMKQLGVGLASAVLIDATIIRAVVLPSLMTLLGRANWWMPGWLRPRTAHDRAPSGHQMDAYPPGRHNGLGEDGEARLGDLEVVRIPQGSQRL